MTRAIDRPLRTAEAAQRELGQTMAEYGLLISLISVALFVVLGVGGFGTALASVWSDVVAKM